MSSPAGEGPDLARMRGVVSTEILSAVEVASAKLREAGIPHALAGGLAVGAHGYPSTTADVVFLVGDEAFLHHTGGIVTLKLPLIAIGSVRIDFVAIEPSLGEQEQLRPSVDSPPMSEQVPIVPLSTLVYMKLKAARQKDIADLVELLKRGRIDVVAIDEYLARSAPHLVAKWRRVKEIAEKEE